MRDNTTSERHQNNNLKAVITFAKFPDVVNKFSNTNLTVTSIENQTLQSYLEQRGQSSQVYFTVLTLIPFAVSCLFIGYYDYKHDEDDESEKIFRKRSTLSMLVGFGMLIVSILSKKVSRNAT